MGREADYTTDLNEIVTGDIKSPVLVLDMICPRLRTVGKAHMNNWSSLQCALRIELDSECTKTCRFAAALKKELKANG